jgi:hypothetical protein
MRGRVETFGFGRAWIDDELGIMVVTFDTKAEIYLAEAKAQVAAMLRLVGDTPVPALIDMRSIHKTDREARRYYAGPDTRKAANACAMVIGSSGIGAVIGNFMIALYGKVLMPLKLFTNEVEAIAWLRGFVKDGRRPREDRR